MICARATPSALVLQRIKQLPDLGQETNAIAFDQHADKAAAIGIEFVPAQRQKHRLLFGADNFGLSRATRTFGSPATRRDRSDHFGPDRQRVLSACELKYGLSVGTRNGYVFSHGSMLPCEFWLKLLFDRREEIGMRFRIDFALQDLLRPGDRQIRNLIAQALLRSHDFLLDFCFGGSDDPIRLGLGQ